MTTTDIAVRAGRLDAVGAFSKVAHVKADVVKLAQAGVKRLLEVLRLFFM